MKNNVFIIAAILVCILGCQTTRSPQWLTLPRGSGQQQILGQTATDDPFSVALNSASAPYHDIHDPFAPVQLGVHRSDAHDLAIKEAERERIKTLATTNRDGAPNYMKPLAPWDGPFANRTRAKAQEQDIIRQVGHGYDSVAARVDFSEPEYDWEKDERKKSFDWSVFDPSNSVSKMRDWMGLGPDENKANTSMQKGREILLTNPDLKDKKKTLEAAKHFSEAAKKFPDSLLEEDALHLAGECYFFADQYSDAFSSYQKLIIKYQHSKHVDSAVRRVFKIGRYWEHSAEKKNSLFYSFSNKSLPQYDTFGFAKKAYETIFIYDPLGPIADAALMALANAYLQRGKYQGDENYNQAAYYYQRLREDHPSSEYIAQAYENELYARTRAYMGAEHPSQTLTEAKKLADITLWQFNTELDSEGKATILELKEHILEKEAERLWSTGQFYDLKKRHYAAARLQYNALIVEYPQTAYAEKARKRLEQIDGLPDSPSIFGFPVNPFKAEQ